MSQIARGLEVGDHSASEAAPVACGGEGSATASATVVHHTLVPAAEQPTDHVRPHPSQADHAERHGCPPFCCIASLLAMVRLLSL